MAVTFLQFVFTAIEGYIHTPHSMAFWKDSFSKSGVPMRTWMGLAVLNFTICVLNNLSLSFHISVPMHIVLRSGSGVVTMIIGWYQGKRYVSMLLISL
jgi:UDP-xylose/UDP-N-acetylglucosamine transporter B4